MTRRTIRFFVTLALGLLAAPLAAPAPPAAKIPRIGFLATGGRSPLPCGPSGPTGANFVGRLHELGYVEGQTIVMEWRCAELNAERAHQFAAELVQLGVDALVTSGRLAARAAKAATATIPIVFLVGGDPVPELVPSLAHPGGNVTGVVYVPGPGWDFFATHLDRLLAAVPGLTRVALLLTAADASNAVRITPVERAAQARGVHLQPVEVALPDGLEAAFAAMTRQGVGGVLVGFDAQLDRHHARIAELAARSRLPSIAELRTFAEQGGLMAYGANRGDQVRRAATHLDKILKGATPGDLPVEQPTTFELVINLKTAQALGLTIPPALLFQATEVIR